MYDRSNERRDRENVLWYFNRRTWTRLETLTAQPKWVTQLRDNMSKSNERRAQDVTRGNLYVPPALSFFRRMRQAGGGGGIIQIGEQAPRKLTKMQPNPSTKRICVVTGLDFPAQRMYQNPYHYQQLHKTTKSSNICRC